MGRKENSFKKYLMKTMGTLWDAQSHEDQHSNGIPDLSFGALGVNGWIELKQVDDYPTHFGSLIKPKKYTPEQVNWIRKRDRKAGNCFVFVKVGPKDYYLFKAKDAKRVKEGMTMTEYETECLTHWLGKVDSAELLIYLTSQKWEA